MDTFDTEALAERAGVAVDFVSGLVDIGIVTPKDGGRFNEGDVRRVSIMRGLELAGLPTTSIAKVLRQTGTSLDFVDTPSYGRYASRAGPTFSDVSARTGIPFDTLRLIRDAMGFAAAQPNDRMRSDELEVVPLLEVLTAQGISPGAIERTLRVGGDGVRRLAETEAAWWRSEVMEPLLQSQATAAQVGSLSAAFAAKLADAADRSLLGLYHGRQSNAWLQNIFEGFERLVEDAGLRSHIEHPPAICFLDVTGYTRLTEQRGDQAAADLAGRLGRLVERTSGRHGGRPIKWLGDGVMFHFRASGPAVEAALEMIEGAAQDGLPPAHVGLHAGPVLFQEGDYFGRTVNTAARIADYARPGELLVSQDIVDESGPAPVRFTPIGPVELKGVGAPLALFAASRA
jgi:adenylate cyclase